MINHDYILLKIAESRHQELIAEAQAWRMAQLAREGQSNQSNLWQRLAWNAGDWMISLGHKLQQAQAEPIGWENGYEGKVANRLCE